MTPLKDPSPNPDLPAPTTADEYLKRFHNNQRITGFGIGNVYQHCPCPFCAAPDWLVFEILDTETSMSKDTRCKECGRSAKALVQRAPGGIQFEFVQTGGPDQPDWLTPPMRRV